MNQKKTVLLLTMLAVLFLSTSAMAGILVDADWLKTHQNDANIVVVDVQNKSDSYGKGHLPGAVKVVRHVDLEDVTRYPANKYPQQRQFLELMARLGIDNNSTVVAYDDKASVFASRMLFILEMYGHDVDKLKLLDGGITNWTATGNTISTTPSKPRSAASYVTAGADLTLLVSWSDILNDVIHNQKSNVVLHDARPTKEFDGTKIRTIRGGHIPGAINLEGKEAANNKNQTFKDIDSIRQEFIEAEITSDEMIYTYCHSSDRSAHAYMVLKHMLGYSQVKIYEGAWNEWGTMTALPAEQEIYK